jgi:L-idonate 5-dehydrogenase
LLAAQQRGVGSVFVVDMLRHKLDMAARLGAAPADARTTDVSMLAHEQIGGLGFTHIIDAVAVSSTIKQALPALAPGGTLTLVGLATPLVEMGLYDLVPQERIVNSAYAYTAGEYRHAVDLITTRTIDVRPLIEDVCSLEDAPDRFAQLAAGTSDAIKVVVEIMA